MYVVRSGRLEVLREGGGDPELLDELGRGSVIGELGLLSAGSRAASIRSRRDASLLRIDRERFTEMLGDARFATGIAGALAEQLRHSRRRRREESHPGEDDCARAPSR